MIYLQIKICFDTKLCILMQILIDCAINTERGKFIYDNDKMINMIIFIVFYTLIEFMIMMHKG